MSEFKVTFQKFSKKAEVNTSMNEHQLIFLIKKKLKFRSSAAVSNAINSLSSNTAMLSAEEKRRVLEEEAKTLEQFKNNHLKKQTSLSSPTNENLFLNGSNGITPSTNGHHSAGSTSASKPVSNTDDLFGLDLNNLNSISNGVHSANHSQPSSANDDLLMLSGANPFLQSIVNQSYSTPTNTINPFQNNMFQQAPPPPAPAYQTTFPPTNSMFPVSNNQNKLGNYFQFFVFLFV